MAFISAEKKEHNKAVIKFSIPQDKFQDEVTNVFHRKAATITVPGFRRGKAPRSVVEKMYGKGAFYEEALNNLIPASYNDALTESGLAVIGRPSVDCESIEGDVVLIAEVVTRPEVSVSDYRGINVTREVAPVTDEEINSRIDEARKRNARSVSVSDRAAAEGDTANIDYEGSVDGVPFEGGADKGHDLKLGSHSFIPGFEEQVAGHSVGDEFDVNVTFPTEYHADALAGKAAVFKVKLNAITTEELPVADDEFAKDVSEFDTFDEYKADITAKLQDSKEKEADANVEGQLIDALLEKLEGEIPDEMYVEETENFVRDFDSRLRMQGMDLSAYFKYTGLDLDKLREQFRPQAERQVKTRLALEKIASLEGISATEEETGAEYAKLAEAYGMEESKVREVVDAADISKDIVVKKAIDLVKEAAVVSGSKKKAAPKARAKAETDESKTKPAAKKPRTTKKAEPKE